MYRDVRGKLRSAGTFTTEKQANRAWQKAEVAIASGRIGDPRRGRQRFADYVRVDWFPNHVIERSTRQNYTYVMDRYVVPFFGDLKMVEILPSDVREWIGKMQAEGARPPTIRQCKVILDAVLTTALNDRITYLHAGKGVKTPAVARKVPRIITVDQFDRLYNALADDTIRLLVETDIESGLRWGELTELRVKDLDLSTGQLTIRRAVVQLNPKFHPDGLRFLVKDYPKDNEWRRLRLNPELVDKIRQHIAERGLTAADLLFEFRQEPTRRRTRPEMLPDPATLGLTEPNERGRTYQHGTLSGYTAGKCHCVHCRDAMAHYRAQRRAGGLDAPRPPRIVESDGHIPKDWFRRSVWEPALARADLGFRVTPHGLRHAHASWLLAGGADIQIVKERLGHGSIMTTEKYLHSLPGADDAALAAFNAIRGQRPAGGSADKEAVEVQDVDEARALV
jgi:integrase